MSDQPRIVAFAGSARKDSLNLKLVKVAAEGARAAGANVTVLDMRDFPMPLFNQDLEQAEGPPENASKLKEIMSAHGGLLIASPEYNSSITPLLKNTIDWVSRAGERKKALAAYEGKVAAVMSASPGRLGGLRGLVHLRSILSNIGVLVIPDQVSVGQAQTAFDEDGDLVDEGRRASIQGLGQSVAKLLHWNRCPEPLASRISNADCRPFEKTS